MLGGWFGEAVVPRVGDAEDAGGIVVPSMTSFQVWDGTQNGRGRVIQRYNSSIVTSAASVQKNSVTISAELTA